MSDKKHLAQIASMLPEGEEIADWIKATLIQPGTDAIGVLALTATGLYFDGKTGMTSAQQSMRLSQILNVGAQKTGMLDYVTVGTAAQQLRFRVKYGTAAEFVAKVRQATDAVP